MLQGKEKIMLKILAESLMILAHMPTRTGAPAARPATRGQRGA
jgi:hypothetical protein